jgi:hypothetical protein
VQAKAAGLRNIIMEKNSNMLSQLGSALFITGKMVMAEATPHFGCVLCSAIKFTNFGGPRPSLFFSPIPKNYRCLALL